MNQVTSPKKNKMYQYPTAERAAEVAQQVMNEQKCKLVRNHDGDWVVKTGKKQDE